MASWTTMRDLTTGDLVTEADMDAIRGNIEYLLNPNIDEYIDTNTATSYSTTSTSFVDVDNTNLNLTITTYGGPVLILVMGALRGPAASEYVYLDVSIDGSREGDTTRGLVAATSTSLQRGSLINMIKTGLSAGSHTFKLQYASESGSAAYFKADYGSVIFQVIEI